MCLELFIELPKRGPHSPLQRGSCSAFHSTAHAQKKRPVCLAREAETELAQGHGRQISPALCEAAAAELLWVVGSGIPEEAVELRGFSIALNDHKRSNYMCSAKANRRFYFFFYNKSSKTVGIHAIGSLLGNLNSLRSSSCCAQVTRWGRFTHRVALSFSPVHKPIGVPTARTPTLGDGISHFP